MSVEAFEAVFGHFGPWTEEAYLAIPETPARIELLSGVLVVNALPDYTHQRLTPSFRPCCRAGLPDRCRLGGL